LNSKQQPLPKIHFTCKQITTFEPNKNTARLSIQNYDYPNSKFSKKRNFIFLRAFYRTPGRQDFYFSQSMQVDNLPSLLLGWPLGLESLHHSQLLSPSLPLPALALTWPENRGKTDAALPSVPL
jgi:hypothetical protein